MIELGRPKGNTGDTPANETSPQLPFIDFHYAPAGGYTAPYPDYNARLQNDADGRLAARFAPGGEVLLEKGEVTATSSSGGAAHMIQGGFVANPDLTATTRRPFTWSGNIDNGFGATGWAPIFTLANYRRSDLSPGPQQFVLGYVGMYSIVTYGTAATPATGITHAFTAQNVVAGSADAENEQACFVGFHRYDNTNDDAGRAWMTDFNLHGARNARQGLLNGICMFMNNYYTGTPSISESANMWIMTRPGSGGGGSTEHTNATTYPIDNGLAIVGGAGTRGTPAQESADKGFRVGIRIGGNSAGAIKAGGPWGIQASRIGKGMHIQDYEDYGIHFPSRWNLASGTAPAIRVEQDAGGIFALGGLVIKSRSSSPTTPPAEPNLGSGQMVLDTSGTRGRLWVRVGTTWRSLAF